MTKMTDAFKKVFLGLGGNPKELAENNDVGDYILDLESAIKEYVGDKTEDLIDDTEASSTKTYSSTKIESLIPANESNVVIFDATTPTNDVSTITSHTRQQIIDIVGTDFAENKPQTVTYLRFKISNGSRGDKYIRLRQDGCTPNAGTTQSYDICYSCTTWVNGKGLVRFDANVTLKEFGTNLTALVEENIISTT